MTGWAALLGALGFVALAFGLLSAMMAAFQPLADLSWVWGNLVVGVVLLGAAIVSSLDTIRERLSSGEGRRVGRYGSSAMFSTLLIIAILLMLAFLSVRYTKRFDWTEQQIHTLTTQTLDLLAGLERDVEVTAFFNELDAPPVRDLLERYAYASDHFVLEFADPNERPDLIEAYGIDEAKLARGLVRISTGGESVELDEFSESAVTNSMVKLTRTGDKTIYFLTAHNERAIDGEVGNAKEGFSRAADALRNENYRVETLLLASMGAVPADADVVVIAGPTRPFADAEHVALEQYLAGGGGLLVLLDPRANTDLYDDLRNWGVDVGNDVIFDQQLALFGRATSPFAAKYATDHPITAELREVVLFDMARSISVDESSGADLSVIVSTGKDSWAERDLEEWKTKGRARYGPDDLLGPVPIAVAGTPKLREDEAQPESETDVADAEPGADSAKPRLVVVGDADYASNEVIESFRNRDLFVNSVNWLMGDVEHISVRPHLSRASRFQLTSDQFRRINYLSLFVLPQAIAVLGVFAWWSRRMAPGR